MKKEQITIRLPNDLMIQVERQAEERGISVNAYLLLVIDEYLSVHQK